MLRLAAQRNTLETEQAVLLRRLKRMFDGTEKPPEHPLRRYDLSTIKRGEFYDEDPIFDSWVQMNRAGKVPASWFSPELRAKMGTKQGK